MISLSVLIPTYGRVPFLLKCVRALQHQTFPASHTELVIVSSEPREMPSSLQTMLQSRPFARVVWCYDPPGGPARARNRAIEAARGSLLLFLDDDVVLHEDALAHHVEAHRRETNPRVVFLGRVEMDAKQQQTAFGRWMEEGGRHFLYPRFRPGQVLPPERFYTAQISLKRAFLKDERFNEQFVAPGYEDGDLGLRLGKRGMILRYLPEARGIHLRPAVMTSYWERVETVGKMRPLLLSLHPERRHWVERIPGILPAAAWLAPRVQRWVEPLGSWPARTGRWLFPLFTLTYGLTLLRGVARSPFRD